MKKNIFIMSLIMILILSCITVYGQSKISIKIDTDNVEFTQSSGEPFIDDAGRTLVPVSVVLQKYGAKVDWNNDTREAIITKDNTTVKIKIGEKYILKNNEKIEIDTFSRIVSDRTYLPIRAVIEAFGSEVQWDKYANTVVINTVPVDAEKIFDKANEVYSSWKNFDMDVNMDMELQLSNLSTDKLAMKYNMYMSMFNEPLKAKISAKADVNFLGESFSDSIMDMYITVDEKGAAMYMGAYEEGKITWMKNVMEDDSFLKLMKAENANDIQAQKKYIKTIKSLGKYLDSSGKVLDKIEYVVSGDLYKDALSDYVNQLSKSANEEEVLMSQSLKFLLDGSMKDMEIVMYVEESTHNIKKYEMDLSSLMSGIVEPMIKGYDLLDQEMTNNLLNSLKVKITMDVLNINSVKDFSVPQEALNAPSALTVQSETQGNSN